MEIQLYSNQWAGRIGDDVEVVPTRRRGAVVVTEPKPCDIAPLFEAVIWASLFLSGISAVLMALLL